jgi:hypothetical protein
LGKTAHPEFKRSRPGSQAALDPRGQITQGPHPPELQRGSDTRQTTCNCLSSCGRDFLSCSVVCCVCIPSFLLCDSGSSSLSAYFYIYESVRQGGGVWGTNVRLWSETMQVLCGATVSSKWAQQHKSCQLVRTQKVLNAALRHENQSRSVKSIGWVRPHDFKSWPHLLLSG